MRRCGAAGLLFLIGVVSVAAQGNGTPPAGGAAAPTQPAAIDPAVAAQRLEEILDIWERDAQAFSTAYAQFTQKKKYNHLQGQEVSFYGEAKFMRIDEKSYGGMILAREMLPDGKVSEENYEKYLFTGAYLYTFLPREKTVLVQGLAPQDTGQPPGAAMPFFFGMKKDELRRRYQLEVVKIDEHYTYLGVRPLLASLQQDFHYARLVVLNHDYVKANAQGQQALWIPRYMPKQLYWIEPNKSEVTWDMVMILRNPPETVVKRDDFDRNRQIPPGWKQQNFEQPKAPLPGGPVPPPRRGP